MDNFYTFCSQMLTTFASFCMTEPIKYFVGIFILLFIVGLFKNMIKS